MTAALSLAHQSQSPVTSAHLSPTSPSKLRILHIISSVSPNTGGPATVVTHLAAAQAAAGNSVTILATLDPRDRTSYLAATRFIPDFEAVQTRLFPWATTFARWFGARLMPTYNAIVPKHDIVHIHGVWEPMLVAAATAARSHQIPYLIRTCGMLDPWSLKQRPFKKRVALLLSHKRMLDRASFIHALSFEESRLMDPLKIRAPHLIIPNGVCLDEIDSAPSDALFSQLPELKSKPYILYLGRLHQKKGLDLLAEAFVKIAAQVPELQLLVVGPDGGAKQPFLQIIRKHNLESRVHVPGTLLGAAKFAAYRHAACFCLPSRQEGFSNSIIEALASSTPVAISTECHFPELAKIGAGRIFELNADAAAHALLSILSAPQHHQQQIGTSARSYIERELTWHNIASQTLDAYRSLVHPHQSQSRLMIPHRA